MEIVVSNGLVALIDDEDYEKVAGRRWHCSHNGYAVAYAGRGKQFSTHRLSMNAPAGVFVDHARLCF
jgi:hypothetical protein